MYDSLTIFKNHKSKLYTIHPDSTRFSIMDCQSITANHGIIRVEKEFAEDDGFVEVDAYEFEQKLKEDNPTVADSMKKLNDSLESLIQTMDVYLQKNK